MNDIEKNANEVDSRSIKGKILQSVHNLRMRRRRQRGLGLLDYFLVSVLLGLAATNVLSSYQNTNNTSRQTETIQLVGSISAAVRNMYAGASSFNGLTAAQVNQSNQIPARYRRGTTALAHPFGGAVTITPTGTSGTEERFSITLAALPRDICIRLATADYGVGLYNMTIGSTLIGTAGSGTLATVTQAQTSCVAPSTSLTIEFY